MNQIKFTLQDHLNAKCDMRTYYGQFVTENIRMLILATFCMEELKAAYHKSTFLRSINMRRWDKLAWSAHVAEELTPLFEQANDGFTPVKAVKILKEAACQIVEEQLTPHP